jgi:hypothetical protein
MILSIWSLLLEQQNSHQPAIDIANVTASRPSRQQASWDAFRLFGSIYG